MKAMPDDTPDGAPRDDDKPNALQRGLKYTHIAFVIPASVIMGWIFGALLDRWLGTTWLYLAGLGLGVVAGFYDLIRTVMRMSKEDENASQ
jgi:F0F1-type ATP synthase assembly protein I